MATNRHNSSYWNIRAQESQDQQKATIRAREANVKAQQETTKREAIFESCRERTRQQHEQEKYKLKRHQKETFLKNQNDYFQSNYELPKNFRKANQPENKVNEPDGRLVFLAGIVSTILFGGILLEIIMFFLGFLPSAIVFFLFILIPVLIFSFGLGVVFLFWLYSE